jgi:hypothetical protein
MRRLLWALPLLLVGCATYNDIGNGRYDVTRTTEVRSPFGTNMGFAKVENCAGVRPSAGATLEFTDCRDVTTWVPMSSQGQGGTIAAGALQGIGLGVAGALIGNGSASATATAGAVATGGKGH